MSIGVVNHGMIEASLSIVSADLGCSCVADALEECDSRDLELPQGLITLHHAIADACEVLGPRKLQYLIFSVRSRVGHMRKN